MSQILELEIQRFHSRDQLCKFPKEQSVWTRKEFKSQRIGLGHQHGRRFIFVEQQYSGCDVT